MSEVLISCFQYRPDYPIRFIVLSEITARIQCIKMSLVTSFGLKTRLKNDVFEEGPDSLMMDVLNGDSDGVFVVRFTVRHHYHQFSLQVSYCIV